MTIRARDLSLGMVQFLNELLAAEVRFAWGNWDCNTFVLVWIDAVLGTGLASMYRGKYDSEASARSFAAGLDHGLADVCASAGLRMVPGGPKFAQPGDVLLVANPGEPWQRGHICAGRHFVSVWPESGLESRPMESMPDTATVWRFA